jgi:hypothetical protein
MRNYLYPIAAVLLLAATAARADDEKLVQAGTVDIDQTRVAFMISGNAGGGVLHYRGKDYPFSIGGLGVGGIGVSKLKASGQVYNMTDRANFAGVYSQLRSGITVADQGAGNKLWLKNGDGVVLKLEGKSEGLALSLGADAVNISFK